jgi:general stress protein YciG
MAGTKEGGAQAAQTNKELHGENFYKEIGAVGGRAKNPNKGFGSDRERARTAGILGGQRSKRGRKVTV